MQDKKTNRPKRRRPVKLDAAEVYAEVERASKRLLLSLRKQLGLCRK